MTSSLPRLLAHRGAAAEAPENTMPAFDLAAELGVGGIETDVRLTADGVPVLHHDEDVSRTTDGEGSVGELTLEEVRALDAGAGRGPRFEGTRIPTLEEFLDRYAGRLWIDLELKATGPGAGGLVDAVAEALEDHPAEGVLVSSFRPDVVEVARQRLPEIPRALITDDAPREGALESVADGLDALGVHAKAATPQLVDRVHDLDLALFAWTVNDEDQARRLYKAGVDGLITDDPRRILRVSPP